MTMVSPNNPSLESAIASIGRYTKDAIVITDPGDEGPHKIVWCNEAFTDLTGYALEEVLGKSPAVLRGPETAPEHSKVIAEALRNWQGVRQEILNYRKDGDPFWTDLSISPVTDEKGYCHYWVATQRDISSRKKLLDELRATEERLERVASEAKQHRARLTSLVDNAPGSLYEFAMDTEGQFSFPYLSEGFAELYGLPKERVADFSSMVFEVVHPDDIDVLHQSILVSAEKMSRWTCRWRIAHPLGERWLEGGSIPHLEEATGTIVWSGYISDVTSQVSWEQELEKAKVQAEAANDAKSQFLANMSHEIRTPLNGVLGMAQALRGTALDDMQQDYLDSIARAGEGLLYVLNDILDFSKIESQRVEVSARPFNLSRLCEGVHRIHTVHTQEKGLDFSLSMNLGEQAGRFGDPDRLTQILHNLLGNAIKFTSHGHVALDVHTTSDQGGRVVFTVSDTGCGISKDHLPHLFDRFNQADAGLRREHSGTGLGLAISKGLVELMGGELTVESTVGQGTTFRFSLPLPSAELPEIAPVSAPKQQAAVSILCADDTEINQKVLTALLRPFGHNVVVANNGQEAVNLCSSHTFDIVLMDIQMPVMDGIEALRRIRSMESARTQKPVPMVAVSGNAMDHQVKEYLGVGFDAVMSKPINIDQLSALIAKLCDTSEQEQPQEAVSH